MGMKKLLIVAQGDYWSQRELVQRREYHFFTFRCDPLLPQDSDVELHQEGATSRHWELSTDLKLPAHHLFLP